MLTRIVRRFRIEDNGQPASIVLSDPEVLHVSSAGGGSDGMVWIECNGTGSDDTDKAKVSLVIVNDEQPVPSSMGYLGTFEVVGDGGMLAARHVFCATTEYVAPEPVPAYDLTALATNPEQGVQERVDVSHTAAVGAQGHPPEPAPLTEDERGELAQWRELAGRCTIGDYPLLPRPDWLQDVAFLAFTIDGLRQNRPQAYQAAQAVCEFIEQLHQSGRAPLHGPMGALMDTWRLARG